MNAVHTLTRPTVSTRGPRGPARRPERPRSGRHSRSERIAEAVVANYILSISTRDVAS